MKPATQRLSLPLLGVLTLTLAGALAYGSARAGDAPVSTPDMAPYLRLHDEATRFSAPVAESASRAAAAQCVRQAEQPRAARKEVRG